MIQDILPEVLDNSYKNITAKPEDTLLFFDGSDVLLRGNAQSGISFPTISELAEEYRGNLRYAFSIDDKSFFLLLGCERLTLKGCHWDNVKVLRGDNPHVLCFAGFTGVHLYRWYRNNVFCGCCGHRTTHSQNERSLICPQCHHQIFPSIMPAVIVGLIDGDKILVTKYNHRTYRGTALIAGFCEIGERPEDTVRRELMEEVGLKAKNIRYFGSQPWGMDQNILIGFFADVDGSTQIIREEDELSEANWVSADDLPLEFSPISLTHEMMMHFKREHGTQKI